MYCRGCGRHLDRARSFHAMTGVPPPQPLSTMGRPAAARTNGIPGVTVPAVRPGTAPQREQVAGLAAQGEAPRPRPVARRWRERLEERELAAGRDLAATWTGRDDRVEAAGPGAKAFAATWPPRASEHTMAHELDGACNGALPRTGSVPSVGLSPVEHMLWASYPSEVLPAGMMPRACERERLFWEGPSFEPSGGRRWCGVARNEVPPQLAGGVAQALDAWGSWQEPPGRRHPRRDQSSEPSCVAGIAAEAEEEDEQCPACGSVYMQDANFCRICGRERAAAPREPPRGQRPARCPACRETYTEDSRFCRRCGRARS